MMNYETPRGSHSYPFRPIIPKNTYTAAKIGLKDDAHMKLSSTGIKHSGQLVKISHY